MAKDEKSQSVDAAVIGAGVYREKCDAVADAGYEGFHRERDSAHA